MFLVSSDPPLVRLMLQGIIPHRNLQYFAASCPDLTLLNGNVSYDGDPLDDGHHPVGHQCYI